MKSKIGKIVSYYLFPKACVACDKALDIMSESFLCEDCNELFVPNIIRRKLSNGVKCISYCKYGGVSRDSVINLKFHRQGDAAKLFGDKLTLLYDVTEHNAKKENSIVIPIPISRRRMAKRGYNQSELIAKRFTENTGIRIVTDAVKKVKHNEAQSLTSDVSERQSNVKGAYKLIKPDLINGRDVVVIDDVITTGSTMKEFTDLLLPYAKSVYCLTVASAELDKDDDTI